jgi:hypothetical protein
LLTTAERFTNENFYETKTATVLIIRTKEVSPLPCIQRSGIAAGVEFIACPARNYCPLKI